MTKVNYEGTMDFGLYTIATEKGALLGGEGFIKDWARVFLIKTSIIGNNVYRFAVFGYDPEERYLASYIAEGTHHSLVTGAEDVVRQLLLLSEKEYHRLMAGMPIDLDEDNEDCPAWAQMVRDHFFDRTTRRPMKKPLRKPQSTQRETSLSLDLDKARIKDFYVSVYNRETKVSLDGVAAGSLVLLRFDKPSAYPAGDGPSLVDKYRVALVHQQISCGGTLYTSLTPVNKPKKQILIPSNQDAVVLFNYPGL